MKTYEVIVRRPRPDTNKESDEVYRVEVLADSLYDALCQARLELPLTKAYTE